MDELMGLMALFVLSKLIRDHTTNRRIKRLATRLVADPEFKADLEGIIKGVKK